MASFTYGQCFAYTDLAPKNNIVFNSYRSGNTYLCREQTIFTDHRIMTDMHQIIYFGSCTDDCIAAYAPVNRAAGTDLHIIFNHYPAATGHFFIMNIPVCFLIVIKSIAANNSTCLDDHIIPDNYMVEDCYVWMNNTIFANRYMVTDIGIGHDDCSLPIIAVSLIIFMEGLKGLK